MNPLATCTVWVALDDVDAENGCMRFVPGSHATQQTLPHVVDSRPGLVLNQTVAPGQLDRAAAAVDVSLGAGQFSMHDIHLVHGSHANTSARRRAGVAIRYMPATSHFERKRMGDSGYAIDFESRPIWLLRGGDACGKNDFAVGHGAGEKVAPSRL
jgi:ectoine hydroxylase-related dioxygenase (phytanoyl-CoA dioxygenase family)